MPQIRPGFVAVSKTHDHTFLVLMDFPVGGHKLQPEHTEALDRLVVPVLMNNGSASVAGLSSTSGSESRNMEISTLRAAAAVEWLMGRSGKDLNIKEIFAHGEAYARARGVADDQESSAFRSVIIAFWSNPVPPNFDPDLRDVPTPKDVPGMSGIGMTSVAIDVLGGVDMAVSLMGAGATSAAGAGLVGGAVTVGGFALTILGPSATGIATLVEAEQLAEFNSRCEGLWDAYQVMAKQYSSESIRYLPLSKWPALQKPVPGKRNAVLVGRYADLARKGYEDGFRLAHEAVLKLETKPAVYEQTFQRKKFETKVTGRILLRILWLKHGKKVDEAIHAEIDKELVKQGKGAWPVR